MGKKKKKIATSAEQEGPDPRMLALKSIIADEVKGRKKEERVAKRALLPLKRVNSNPLIYEFLPIARSLYSESRSVDFGFDGTVDIPNQTFYMEEVPDDILDTENISRPESSELNLTASLSFIKSPTVDAEDVASLKKVQKHDTLDFLKTRVGTKNLDKIYETVKSPYENLPVNVEAQEIEKKSKRKRSRCIFIIILVILLLVLAGTAIGLALSDGGGAVNTTIASITDATTPSPSSTNEEFSLIGQGSNSGQFAAAGTSEMAVITAYLTELDGKPVDTNFKYVWPPDKEKLEKITTMLTEVYKYLGFVLEVIVVNTIEPLEWGSWKIDGSLFARAKYNQDLMMWYGYNEHSTEVDSDYLRRINKYCQEAFVKLYNSTMAYYVSFFGPSFLNETQRYFGKMNVRRPPAHIPDGWGYCTGSPVCPVDTK